MPVLAETMVLGDSGVLILDRSADAISALHHHSSSSACECAVCKTVGHNRRSCSVLLRTTNRPTTNRGTQRDAYKILLYNSNEGEAYKITTLKVFIHLRYSYT